MGLKPKKVKGRIKVLKALPYKKVMVYLRKINEDIFEYIIPFKGEIYSSYLIIKPRKGKNKLTKNEINQAAALILVNATATIDHLLGIKLDDKIKETVKVFEGARKQMEGLPN